jgi:hypothetical protein
LGLEGGSTAKAGLTRRALNGEKFTKANRPSFANGAKDAATAKSD